MRLSRRRSVVNGRRASRLSSSGDQVRGRSRRGRKPCRRRRERWPHPFVVRARPRRSLARSPRYRRPPRREGVRQRSAGAERRNDCPGRRQRRSPCGRRIPGCSPPASSMMAVATAMKPYPLPNAALSRAHPAGTPMDARRRSARSAMLAAIRAVDSDRPARTPIVPLITRNRGHVAPSYFKRMEMVPVVEGRRRTPALVRERGPEGRGAAMPFGGIHIRNPGRLQRR